jgi:asparagine synthase (glutamine-hydrolysing)
VCGIYGRIFAEPLGHDRKACQADCARRAQQALRHRGPDGSGLWQDERATLAHTRLKIIDPLPRGDQPLQNEDGQVVVVYNGEIYNFAALRAELEAHGHRFRSRTDTEVLVHGYEQWSVDLVHRLDGMFAFGLWDRAQQQLLLARDRAGQKPLFYHAPPDGPLTFASEIKGLSAASIALRVRTRAILDFLIYGYVPPPETFYPDVFQLEPAHFLISAFGRPQQVAIETRRYWQVSFQCPPNRQKLTTRAAIAQVRDGVEKAVEKRLIADVPLGAFLSGGLDSTIVVGLMSRLKKEKVRTFSIGFAADQRYDETQYARLAAKRFGTDHTEFVMHPQPFEVLDTLIAAHDGPFSDSSAIPTAVLSRLTKDEVTVALTGDGGDELFGGYMRFWAGAMAEKLPGALRRGLTPLCTLLPAADERTTRGRVRRFLDGVSQPLPERMLRWQPNFAFQVDRLCRPEILRAAGRQPSTAGDPAFAANPTAGDRFAFQHRIFAATRKQSPLARLLDHNFRTYLPQDLQVKMDRCSMAAALEARSPFLDKPLIETCAALPDRLKIRFGITKFVLRCAFADLVPPAILTRTKMGFGVPLDRWFRNEWKTSLSDALLDPRAKIYSYLHASPVRRYVHTHLTGRAHWGHQLFSLLTLERWLQKVDRPTPAALDI